MTILSRCSSIRLYAHYLLANARLQSNESKQLLQALNDARSHEPEVEQNLSTLFPSDIEERNQVYKNYREAERNSSMLPKIDPKQTSIIMFPGQGSQFIGMGKKLMHYPKVKDMYDKASALLGYDIMDLCLYGPKDKLDSTLYCQPAVFVTSLAATEKLKDDFPSVIENCIGTAGYSVGEYAAVVFAGALSFEQGVRVIHSRAKLMHEDSVRVKSGMMSVFLSANSSLKLACQTAEEYCRIKCGIEEPLCRIANYLSPNCKVIAGNIEALRFIQDHHDEFNIRRCKSLPVEGAFHTKLMTSASDGLSAVLKQCKFKDPIIPVLSNVTGRNYGSGKSIAHLLRKQVTSPVKWEQIIHALYSREQGQDFPKTYEVGPGKQLGTLLKVVNAKAHASYHNVDV